MALTWPFHCDLILQRLLYSQATHLLYPNIVHVVDLLISNTVESINHYPKLPSERWWRSIQEKIGTILGLSFVPTFVCSCCVIAAPDSGLWYCYWHRVRALASVLPSGLPCLSYSCWPVTLSGCWLTLLACLDCLIRGVTRKLRKVPAWALWTVTQAESGCQRDGILSAGNHCAWGASGPVTENGTVTALARLPVALNLLREILQTSKGSLNKKGWNMLKVFWALTWTSLWLVFRAKWALTPLSHRLNDFWRNFWKILQFFSRNFSEKLLLC